MVISAASWIVAGFLALLLIGACIAAVVWPLAGIMKLVTSFVELAEKRAERRQAVLAEQVRGCSAVPRATTYVLNAMIKERSHKRQAGRGKTVIR